MNISIGIIGMGVISKFYVSALENKQNDMVLSAVCDLNVERMQPFIDTEISCTTDYKEMLAREDIDAVIINVPNDMHFQICRDALLSGKHVCCEKPMTLTLAEAEELVAISQRTGLTMFTAFHRSYNVHFIKALQEFNSVDEIDSVSASYLEKIEDHAGNDKWYLQPDRCGGGCVADNGPNVFDTLAYFLGHMTVRTAEITRDKHNVDLNAHICLVTETGIPVQVHLDWAYQYGEKKDIRIVLKNGQEIYVDMLKGFTEFKSSLYHEYEAILLDFNRKIQIGNCHGEDGLDAVRLVNETYGAEVRKV